ncbi:hypothetical protein [Chryseobacterium potabilaquae]|uniref:Uncharacterized protein n=1 Tax=Chryseobacterium potabilaquae TaxID=2675057 RepID=A0A6N4X7I8_9FLAO|nr:hypothetical protein [Chryseobacterium potabilaquae]CAA7194140.1 hypothetical protein CHRY9293_00517 [Chryseobacterium potabilaquae]
MKKQIKKEKKLSLEKLQLVKINNPKKIFGGTKQFIEGCGDPNNASGNNGGIDTGK